LTELIAQLADQEQLFPQTATATAVHAPSDIPVELFCNRDMFENLESAEEDLAELDIIVPALVPPIVVPPVPERIASVAHITLPAIDGPSGIADQEINRGVAATSSSSTRKRKRCVKCKEESCNGGYNRKSCRLFEANDEMAKPAKKARSCRNCGRQTCPGKWGEEKCGF
jgi:hypothetical protein